VSFVPFVSFVSFVILSRTTISTPIGDMLALATEDTLCALEFVGPRKRLTRLERRLTRWFPPHQFVDRETAAISRTRKWLATYFEGTAPPGDLPIAMHGAPFEKKVWQALLRIPPGETTSYGAIASALGSPGAARAVGAANGANPIAIVVPCHRVIGSSGSLVGYGGGLNRKTWLLDHERRWRRDRLF
jgi:AraC family transcriptional regulator, regulatory protein of adaptative response / methylated-DNA-[protein]-cysteine methyltransferase